MSEERLGAIEQRLDSVDRSINHLSNRVDQVEVNLTSRMDRLEGEVGGLGGRIERLTTHMHVLHEDLVDRIKALAPDFHPLRREFTQADDKLRDDLDIRLGPLEADLRMRSRKRRRNS